jgi:hypothetical protein
MEQILTRGVSESCSSSVTRRENEHLHHQFYCPSNYRIDHDGDGEEGDRRIELSLLNFSQTLIDE